MSTELSVQDNQLSAPSVGSMLNAVIQSGVTGENVAVLERLVALKERDDARNAEMAFATAFVELQRELPVIVASSVIPNRGKYERFEDVMRVVGPLLVKNGFALSFANAYVDNRVTETCRLSHVGGHSQCNSFTVRVGGKADSDTQADCKAATTAKRNALLNALNIVIRQDVLQNEDDAMNEGSPITQAQADSLRDLCDDVKADRGKFLKFVGVERFEDVPSSRYDDAMEALMKRRK